MNCSICSQPVDPSSPTTLVRVQGWERRALGAHRRGGSDIVMRERLDEFAHGSCVERAKSGIAPTQGALSV